MSCKADVNKAILDDIFSEYIDPTRSFKRTGLDTFVVTQRVKNKSKKKATEQANEALFSVLKRIAQEHNGYIRASINRPYSIYDGPIGATLIVDPHYINHVFETQVRSQERGNDSGTLLSTRTEEAPEALVEEAPVETGVSYELKAVNILRSDKARDWFKKAEKNKLTGDTFWTKFTQELQIPKQQVDILRRLEPDSYDRERLLSSMLASMSYSIEINTAMVKEDDFYENHEGFVDVYERNGTYYGMDFEGPIEISRETYETFLRDRSEIRAPIVAEPKPTQHYAYLTAPGGANYEEKEIMMRDVVPVIKGHAAFATPEGIGWYRVDEKASNTDTRRVLELQSDLFQRIYKRFTIDGVLYKKKEGYNGEEDEYYKGGEDIFTGGEFITKQEYNKAFESGKVTLAKDNDEEGDNVNDVNSNNILQILNKGDAWVTFFIKSIIQDSARNSYKKVLFPSGNTANKIEGQQTLDEYVAVRERSIAENEAKIQDLKKDLREDTEKLRNLKPQIRYTYTETSRTNKYSSAEMTHNGKIVYTVNRKMQGPDKSTTIKNVATGETIVRDAKNISDVVRELSERDFGKGVNPAKMGEIEEGLRKNLEFYNIQIGHQERSTETFKRQIEDASSGRSKFARINSFYEKDVHNVLQKNGYAPTRITDEHGNEWYEVAVEEEDGGILLSTSTTPTTNTTDEDQDLVNANKGNESEDGMENEFVPTVGYYEKMVQFREKLLEDYEQRLKQVMKEIDNESYKKVKDAEKMKKLIRDRRWLRREIEGVREIGKKGLRDEILTLKNRQATQAIGYYAEKDLARLEAIIKYGSLEQLTGEGANIIRFYEEAGNFAYDSNKGWHNPVFELDDVFLRDSKGEISGDFKLSREDMAAYEEWARRAATARIRLNKKVDAEAERIINEDAGIQALYGAKGGAKLGDLINPNQLKDTHWIDMWTMDPTKNIVNQDSLLPQIMFNKLQDSVNTKTVEAISIADRVDKAVGEVQVRLKALNQTLKEQGIIGLAQGSYSIYLERNRDGKLSGNYASKYNQDYVQAKKKIDMKFSKDIGDAYTSNNYNKRIKAFMDRRSWYRKNTVILQFNKIPEIIDDSTGEFTEPGEFAAYERHFDRVGAEDYKKQILEIIGEKEYKRQVKEQVAQLRKYETAREDQAHILMVHQGVNKVSELNDQNQAALERWVINNSPFHGINDIYDSVFDNNSGRYRSAGNYQNYNVFIPRKYTAIQHLSPDRRSVVIHTSNTPMPVNYYNKEYEDYIEKDDKLYEFYQILEDAMTMIRRTAPPDLANKLATNFLAAIERTTAEVITNNYNEHNILARVVPAFRLFWDKIKESFGVKEQNKLRFASRDPITGRTNYRVNDSFLRDNSEAIEENIMVERLQFLNALRTNPRTKEAAAFTSLNDDIQLKDMNETSLTLLAKYLGIEISSVELQKRHLTKLETRLGSDNINMTRIIKDHATHEAVKDNSYDLARVIKTATAEAAYYGAKTEALPIIETMKQYYDNIGKVNMTNLGDPIYNIPDGRYEVEGLRENSIKRLGDWFERVVLNNNSSEHVGVLNDSDAPNRYQKQIDDLTKSLEAQNLTADERKALNDRREKLVAKGKIKPLGFGRKVYSTADKKKFSEIELLMSDKYTSSKDLQEIWREIDKIGKQLNDPLLDEDTVEKLKAKRIGLSERYNLLKTQSKLGRTVTGTAFFNNLLNWIRYQRLGWNLSSGVTNIFEGYYNNMVIAADGNAFSSGNVFRAYGLMQHSFLKNLTFGKAETGIAKKIRILMDRFDTMVDPSNELQKASTKTFTDKFEWLQAMTITRRGEYINQGVLLLSTLLDQKVKSTITGNEVNVFDAMDSDGKLMPEYRTEEAVETWENTKGDTWLAYKRNLSNTILLGHGNYDVLRGMMAKSNVFGRALMMFKTWLPQQIYWRFATEQNDLQSKSINFRGKYWSYSPATGAMHGAAVGLVTAGPIGALVGGAIGSYFGFRANNKYKRDSTNMLQETIVSTMMLAKKMIGIPINIVTRRQVIDTNKGFTIRGKTYDFDSLVGKGGFTEQDAKAMKANMADISIQLALIGLMLLTKAMFWDDDDEEDSGRRIAHNVLMNRFMQLSSQAGAYVNIGSKESVYQTTLGSIAVLGYLQDVGKLTMDADKFMHGKDTVQTGVDAGESRLYNQFKQTLVPGMLKTPTTLGFGNQGERQFVPSPFDNYYKLDIAGHRKELRAELEGAGHPNSYILKELNKQFPTKNRIHKLGVTREEYLENPEEMARKK